MNIKKIEDASEIYRNDAGAFIPINAGITSASRSSAAWGDYDNDGDLDLAVSGYGSGPAFTQARVFQRSGRLTEPGSRSRACPENASTTSEAALDV